MGKQTFKEAKTKGKRSGPYSKSAKSGRSTKPKGPSKPTVDVKYDGEVSAATKLVLEKKAKVVSAPTKKVKSAPGKTKEKAKGKGKAVAASPSPSPETDDAPTFKIIAGTYERLLYGLEGKYVGGKIALEPLFIFPAHLACVKAVAASPTGKWLATGSEDEFVKVWDLRRRKEVGSLSQHTGSITSATFPTPSHLLTTSADSTISLFRTSDWALLKSLKGHSGRVNYVDVHPTGRVALSVGKDNTLKMWDLMRGRGAASLALGSEAEIVKFSPRGTHFAVLFPRKIEIYSLTLKKLATLESKIRFNHLLFAELPGEETELLCVGTEKGIVEVYTVEMPGEDDEGEDEDEDDEEEDGGEEKGPKAEVDRIATLVGHTNRIKAISALPFDAPNGSTVLLTTASSDGVINVYDLGAIPTAESEEQQPVASYDTKGSRLTCVFIAEGGAPRRKGKKAPMVETKTGGARFDVEDSDGESEEEEEGDEDMYDVASDEESEGGVEVEFEDEEEEEDEEEGEYED